MSMYLVRNKEIIIIIIIEVLFSETVTTRDLEKLREMYLY